MGHHPADRGSTGPIRRASIVELSGQDRKCLLCSKTQGHTLHGSLPKKDDKFMPYLAWIRKRATLHGYFFHDFDPGERRHHQRRK